MTIHSTRPFARTTTCALTILLAGLLGTGCFGGGDNDTGNESSFLCKTNADCGGNACVNGQCMASGGSGTTSGGSGNNTGGSGSSIGGSGSNTGGSVSTGGTDGSAGSMSQGGGTSPDPVCADAGDTCSQNDECCGFSASPDAVCVNTGSGALCAATCTSGSECNSGCCMGLEDTTAYGVCAPAEYCQTEVDPACVDGIVFFCACGAAADVPCTDSEIESYANACASGGELAAVFTCFGNRGEPATLDECLSDAEVCIPD